MLKVCEASSLEEFVDLIIPKSIKSEAALQDPDAVLTLIWFLILVPRPHHGVLDARTSCSTRQLQQTSQKLHWLGFLWYPHSLRYSAKRTRGSWMVHLLHTLPSRNFVGSSWSPHKLSNCGHWIDRYGCVQCFSVGWSNSRRGSHVFSLLMVWVTKTEVLCRWKCFLTFSRPDKDQSTLPGHWSYRRRCKYLWFWGHQERPLWSTSLSPRHLWVSASFNFLVAFAIGVLFSRKNWRTLMFLKSLDLISWVSQLTKRREIWVQTLPMETLSVLEFLWAMVGHTPPSSRLKINSNVRCLDELLAFPGMPPEKALIACHYKPENNISEERKPHRISAQPKPCWQIWLGSMLFTMALRASSE